MNQVEAPFSTKLRDARKSGNALGNTSLVLTIIATVILALSFTAARSIGYSDLKTKLSNDKHNPNFVFSRAARGAESTSKAVGAMAVGVGGFLVSSTLYLVSIVLGLVAFFWPGRTTASISLLFIFMLVAIISVLRLFLN